MKKIIKSIACCCLSLALAIACCFGAMKMSKNQIFLGTSCNKASAYVYQDSNIPYTFTSDTYIITNFPITSGSNPNYDSVTATAFIPTEFSFSFSRQMGNVPFQISISVNAVSTSSGNSYTTNGYQLAYFRTTPQVFNYTNGYSSRLGFYVSNINLSVDFNKIMISNYLYYDLEKPDYVTYNFVSYTFYNSSDEYVTIFIPLGNVTPTSSVASNYLYQETVTYFLNSSAQFNNNEFYNTGYNNGYDLGFEEGETEGYNNGFNQGNTEGYNNGYVDGLESSERLGFPALITSVIDVPLMVFTSLFNFEILGVKMLTFVTSLLSIALILAIVKKVKGD